MNNNLSIAKLQTLCATVAAAFPLASVAIAGGAVRDLLNRRPVKDIDVFVELNTVKGYKFTDAGALAQVWQDNSAIADEWYTGIEALAKVFESDYVTNGGFEEGAEDDVLDIVNSKGYSYGAFTLVDYKQPNFGWPIQLVFISCHPVVNITDHFDFGLSQCWVTPNQLRMTSAYWHDHFNQRITYLPSREPNEQRRVSSLHRLERLRQKYPGWAFHGVHRLGQLPEPKRNSITGEILPPKPPHPYDNVFQKKMTYQDACGVQNRICKGSALGEAAP